jgi:hypothetical protein
MLQIKQSEKLFSERRIGLFYYILMLLFNKACRENREKTGWTISMSEETLYITSII